MPVIVWWAVVAAAGVVGFGSGVAVSDGLKSAAKWAAIGGGVYLLVKAAPWKG